MRWGIGMTVMETAKDIWSYRELFYFLAWRDVKVRYKQTALGVAWAILQPFLTMVDLHAPDSGSWQACRARECRIRCSTSAPCCPGCIFEHADELGQQSRGQCAPDHEGLFPTVDPADRSRVQWPRRLRRRLCSAVGHHGATTAWCQIGR